MTHEELAVVARQVVLGYVSDVNFDFEALSSDERRTLGQLIVVEFHLARERTERRSAAQKRAMGLLRSLLTPEERAHLRRTHGRCFHVVGSAGGVYRLRPRSRSAERVEKHGSRWFAVERFCYHDPDNELPPADVTIGQMLLLRCDEPGFRAAANVTPALDMLWNGDYLRRFSRRSRHRRGLAQVA